ncbi:MAG: amidase [Betaproteobacteria bacterium]|nr:amidase [Betaproteobacteria bacterium]
MTIVDPWHCFCDYETVELQPTGEGVLSGLSFAIKDNIHVAGFRTGCGNPDWLRTHAPAAATASCVLRLLQAGARLAGKTQCDELFFSLEGENAHYGTPINPAAPDRIPGGSSSGAAVAVASKLVDFAIGTDAGGSVRIPAALCGLWGMRPTHGRMPGDGTVGLAPSLGTIGWFAREPRLLARVGETLLDPDPVVFKPRRLLIAEDAMALADDAVRAAIAPFVARIAARFDAVLEVQAAPEGIANWLAALRTVQGWEAWQTHGEWITREQPNLGAVIRQRFDWAKSIAADAVPPAREIRRRVSERFHALLGDDALLLLPTVASAAPRLGTTGAALDAFRGRTLQLAAWSGATGVPQLALPAGQVDGAPVGLSIIAPRNADRALLGWAEQSLVT